MSFWFTTTRRGSTARARLDYLERDVNEEPLLPHNLAFGEKCRSPRGLGLKCRTLRKAIDQMRGLNEAIEIKVESWKVARTHQSQMQPNFPRRPLQADQPGALQIGANSQAASRYQGLRDMTQDVKELAKELIQARIALLEGEHIILGPVPFTRSELLAVFQMVLASLPSDRKEVIGAIDAEPELPGRIPDGMWLALQTFMLNEDREGMVEVLRIVVRETKNGIRERVRTLAASGTYKS